MQPCLASNSIWTFIPLVFTIMLFAGCSGRAGSLTSVSGVVKANGKRVSQGEIMFYPSGGGRPAMGIIGPDGRYKLTSFKAGDGVVPGSHKVTITVQTSSLPKGVEEVNSVEEETSFSWERERVTWVIPEKYSVLHSTTLTAEVEKGKAMEINFDSADF